MRILFNLFILKYNRPPLLFIVIVIIEMAVTPDPEI